MTIGKKNRKILDIIRAFIIDFRRGGGDIIKFSEGKGEEKSRGEMTRREERGLWNNGGKDGKTER